MLALKYDTALYEERENTVKNYFLYLKPKNTILYDKNIYCFANNLLVAIDTDYYDNKSERLKVCKKYGLTTFNIANELFINMIDIMLSDNQFFVRNVKFDDDDFDYKEDIEEAISLNDRESAINNLYDVTENCDIDILQVTFIYNENLYDLTSEGIIHTTTTDKKFRSFVSNNKISDFIIGYTR